MRTKRELYEETIFVENFQEGGLISKPARICELCENGVEKRRAMFSDRSVSPEYFDLLVAAPFLFRALTHTATILSFIQNEVDNGRDVDPYDYFDNILNEILEAQNVALKGLKNVAVRRNYENENLPKTKW